MKHLTKEEYLASLTPDKLALSELPNTIGQAYLDGIKEADKKYRTAIQVAIKKVGISVSPFFNIILNELNKDTEKNR